MFLFTFFLNGMAMSSEPLRTVLDNGMIVILKENHFAPVVSFHVYVRAGSIYEGEYLGRGISHNLEHLMNSGTTKRTKEQINQIVEEIGNVSNAYTTKDHASYFITTASSYFDKALDVFSDYIQNPSFPEEEVEAERGVILNEINMGKDDPERQLFEIFSSAMFRKHPAGVPTIGYRELFEKTTRDDIVNYHKRMYIPNNMIFVAVGDFDSETALSKIKSAFKDFKRGPLPDFSLPDEPRQVSKRYVEQEMDVQIAYMMLGFHTVDVSHKDLYPLDVLAFIIGEGRSSRLYKTVKDEKQLVYSINAWSATPAYKDGGYFGIMAYLAPENIDSAEKAILEEIYRLKIEFVTDEELEKAKTLKESEYVFSQQTMEDQAETLGIDELSTGDMNFSKRYLEGIKSVTKEDIMRVVNEYFFDDNLTVAVIKPKSEQLGIQEKEIKKKEAIIQKFVLDNGMRILIKENKTLPLVAIRAIFEGGVRYEDEKNNGISNFMSDMLIKGTKSRTAQQIAEEIESMGGSINTFSGNNSFGISLSVLKHDLNKSLDILADVLMNPSFDQNEVEKKRKEILAAISQQEDDPFALAGKLFRQTLFTKHPYRFLSIGSDETVENITRDDIKQFYEKYCVPNNMVLAIFGDVNASEVIEKVKNNFEGFQKKELLAPPITNEETIDSIRENKIQKDIKQVVIYLGFLGMKVDSEERYAMEVLDAILSGISYPGGRLHERLRANQLVYVVHAFNQLGLDPGLFAVYAATTPDKKETVLNIIKEEIESLCNNLISDEELEKGKSICISAKQISLQTNSDQAFNMGLDELYGLGYDDIYHYEERINSVTKEDVKRVAEKYLTLDKYAIAIVEPKAE